MFSTRTMKQLLLFCCLSLPLTGQAFSVSAEGAGRDDHYRQGVSAFKTQDYHTALQHFEAAWRDGNRSQTLIYNLGVTYYKLGRSAESEQHFTQLLPYSRWASLARYNLGLAAKQQGDTRKAIVHFQAVYRAAGNTRLGRLAAEQLNQLGAQPVAVPTEKKWYALATLGIGHDSNVIAFPDQLQQDASQGEDNFTELLAYGQTYVAGSRNDGLRLYGYGYSKQFSDLDFLNIGIYSIGLARDLRRGDWRLDYGGAVTRTSVDGEALTTEAKLRIGATLEDGRNKYTFVYHPGYHDAGDVYPQLEGTVQRFDAKWQRESNAWRWIAGYRFEVHDRDDLESGSDFFSYSPTRHRIEFAADWFVTPNWTLNAGVSQQNSKYDGENRLTDLDGQFKQQQREADKLELWLQSDYDLTRKLRLRAEVRQTDNEDNFEFYDYDRLTVKAALEYAF